MRIRNYVAGFTISLIFGFSFLFTKGALENLRPGELLFLRFSIASLSMMLLAAAGIVKLDFKGKNLKGLAIVSLFQPVLYFTFETLGVMRTATSTAGIILAAIPIAAAVVGIPILREHPEKITIFFIALSSVGVAAVAFGRSGMIPGSFAEDAIGMIFLFCAVATAGFYNVLSRKYSRDFSASETTFAMMFAGMIVFGVYHFAESAVTGTAIFSPAIVRTIPALLYLGCVSSVGAFFLMNYNLATMEASKAAVFLNLVTVVAVAAGVAFRSETIGFIELAGMAFILLGVWGANAWKH